VLVNVNFGSVKCPTFEALVSPPGGQLPTGQREDWHVTLRRSEHLSQPHARRLVADEKVKAKAFAGLLGSANDSRLLPEEVVAEPN
jgi:hypothetical protein